MGAGGVILPPDGYFDAITRVLDKHDIPLIDDEVITGFGRTGEWFGCGDLRLRAGQHDDRQGAVERLSADLRGACCRRSCRDIIEAGDAARSAPSATASPIPAIRSPPPSR